MHVDPLSLIFRALMPGIRGDSSATGVELGALQSRPDLDARQDRCPGASPGQRAITLQRGSPSAQTAELDRSGSPQQRPEILATGTCGRKIERPLPVYLAPIRQESWQQKPQRTDSTRRMSLKYGPFAASAGVRNAARNSPALAFGARGSAVAILQGTLLDVGEKLPVSTVKQTNLMAFSVKRPGMQCTLFKAAKDSD